MAAIEARSDLELDHVFICTDDRSRSLEALSAAGLTPGPSRVHHGQGTANDCFYFDNAYLELLWMNDEAEIRSPVAAPLRLWERIHWRQTGASPFGMALRPMAGLERATLETWLYEAAYLPSGQGISILSPRDAVNEPLVFLSINPHAPSTYAAAGSAHPIHRGQPRRITRVAYFPEEAARSDETGAGQSDGACHMILELDGGRGEVCDLRPTLPLEIRW